MDAQAGVFGVRYRMRLWKRAYAGPQHSSSLGPWMCRAQAPKFVHRYPCVRKEAMNGHPEMHRF